VSQLSGRIYQIKGTIVGTKPPVWRRVLVPETTTLLQLHDILQAAFGWWDSHLHEYEIDGVRYGTDDGEGWGPPPKSERRAQLGAVAKEGTVFRYVYDFGDNWEHKLVVEKILAAVPGATYPDCIAGRRACPPEDCGGVWGYTEFLAAIGDPGHPEHHSMLEWVGGAFDPDEFDASDFAHRVQLGRLVE
jgi:Plasmid pRiA4b ORF-3-like protein